MDDLESKQFPARRQAIEENSDDPVAAYLELALKIYLRIRGEGQPIHRCGLAEFDDDSESGVPCIGQRSAQSNIK